MYVACFVGVPALNDTYAQSASALAATLTWLYKDGAGMLGRIAFAYARGTQLDSDCKKWRLVADGLNDMAMCIDLLLAPRAGAALIYVVCASSVCRAIVGVAGGATRAALTQHQVLHLSCAGCAMSAVCCRRVATISLTCRPRTAVRRRW